MAQATQPTITRRSALHLAAGAVAVAAIPVAALASIEPSLGPIGRLARERVALMATLNGQEMTDEEQEPILQRWKEIDQEIINAKPDTLPELLAMLGVARDDFLQFNSDDSGNFKGDPGQWLVFSALDNALRVLRRLA